MRHVVLAQTQQHVACVRKRLAAAATDRTRATSQRPRRLTTISRSDVRHNSHRMRTPSMSNAMPNAMPNDGPSLEATDALETMLNARGSRDRSIMV